MDNGGKKGDRCKNKNLLSIYYKDSMQLKKITTNIGDLKLSPVLGKIDIEGGKLPALQGMEEVLNRGRPALITKNSKQEPQKY